MFYAFEGINGSGKTTALAALAKRLRARHGESAVVTLFNPSKSPVGTELRRFFIRARDGRWTEIQREEALREVGVDPAAVVGRA